MKRSNGEGTIYKRKDGRWCAAYYDSNDLRRHFVYGKTKAEVKERINEMKQDHQKTGANEVEYTLEDWVVFFLDNYKKNEVKQTTYDTYMGIYRRHVKNSSLGKLKLKRITSNDLQKFYNAKSKDGYNPKTVRRIYVIINSALKKAMQLRYVEENANQYVSLPKKIKYEAQVLSEESVRRIFSEAQNEVLYPIIVLTMCTGLRKGEVMALTWDNVNFQDRELYVEKNLCRVVKSVDENGKLIYENKILEPKTLKSKRTIPLIDKAVEVLNMQKQRQDQIKEKYAKFYNDNGLVFAEWDGGIIKQREFMNDFYAFLDKYNIPRVRFHDLRHTFASMLLNAGETPKAIQELLGHTTISTTMDIYTHITKQTKVNAIKTLELLIEDKE